MTEDDLIPGKKITIRVATNTISKATYEVEYEIVWVENGHVHYRGETGHVAQTPVERFLGIVNNQPRAWCRWMRPSLPS